MIRDNSTNFCDKTTVILAAGTSLLGNVVDLGLVTNGIVDDPELDLIITVGTAIHTAGAAGTIQFKISTDSAAAVGGTSPIDHVLTPVYVTGAADIPAGTILFGGELPAGMFNAYKRFLGVQVIVGTTAITQGTINAFLTPDARAWKPLIAGV